MFNLLGVFRKKGKNFSEQKEGEKAATLPLSQDTEESGKPGSAGTDTKGNTSSDKKEGKESLSPDAKLVRISTDLDRLKASVESFGEVRKGLTERISGISEQIGELRAMILDRDRTIQEIELKAVKAADLVESVQPDKLMIELQKEDAKFEALKANLEGNEAIMNRIMDELKEMRKKLDFFRGIDQIVKLAEEVRKELVEIKKVEASIHADTDKVETIYSELRKKFQEIDLFSDSLKELKVNLEQNSKDVDFLKSKISGLASKDELDKLVQKVQRYIDALHEIDRKSSLSKDISKLKSMLESL